MMPDNDAPWPALRDEGGPSPALRSAVEAICGLDSSWFRLDVGLPGAGARWRVSGPLAAVMVRVHRSPRTFAQERAAAPVLAELGLSPVPLAVVAPERAVVWPWDNARTPQAADVGRSVAAEAGRALARLHAAPVTERDPCPLSAALSRRWRAAANQLGARGIVLRNDAVAAVDGVLRGVTSERVWCHRDCAPRNWLWAPGLRLQLIDLEHARPDWALLDVARAMLEIDGRDASAALFAAWSDESGIEPSTEALRAATVLEQARGLAWALRHGDSSHAARATAGLRLVGLLA
jgi:Ser/Thr protein kinase RdoA (MazF antagonist)